MGLIRAIGRSNRIVYGTGTKTEFRIVFPTPAFKNALGLQYINGQLNTVGSSYAVPTAGTLTIAGTTVTLDVNDIETPSAVAKKIATTAISGYTVSYNKDVVYMTNTTLGPSSRPTLALGTATGIYFRDISSIAGKLAPSDVLDDILILGRTPITLTLSYVGGVAPTVQTSTGTSEEQALGTLTYGSALVFTSGTAIITTPINYIRITNGGDATHISLYITR